MYISHPRSGTFVRDGVNACWLVTSMSQTCVFFFPLCPRPLTPSLQSNPPWAPCSGIDVAFASKCHAHTICSNSAYSQAVPQDVQDQGHPGQEAEAEPTGVLNAQFVPSIAPSRTPAIDVRSSGWSCAVGHRDVCMVISGKCCPQSPTCDSSGAVETLPMATVATCVPRRV